MMKQKKCYFTNNNIFENRIRLKMKGYLNQNVHLLFVLNPIYNNITINKIYILKNLG